MKDEVGLREDRRGVCVTHPGLLFAFGIVEDQVRCGEEDGSWSDGYVTKGEGKRAFTDDLLAIVKSIVHADILHLSIRRTPSGSVPINRAVRRTYPSSLP